MGECASYVYYGAVECESLALMHGDGPCRSQRELYEVAGYRGGYLLCLFVYVVACVLPSFAGHHYGFVFALAPHLYPLVVQSRHYAELAVVVAFIRRRVVAYEHHLSAPFEPEMLLCGVYKLREIVADCSLVGIFIALESGQFAVVDALHGAVMGGEGDVTLLGSGIELGDIAFVYLGQYGSVYHTGAYAVEHVGEPAVVLTVYAGELYGGVEALVQGEAVEEVRAFIEARQYIAFVVLDYRRELLHVAYHEQLHPAERLGAAAVTAQYVAYGVEQVAAYHAYLVYDE